MDDGMEQGGCDEEELFGISPEDLPSFAHRPGHSCAGADVSMASADGQERRRAWQSETLNSEYSTTESYQVKLPRMSASGQQQPPRRMGPVGGASTAANEAMDDLPQAQRQVPGQGLPEEWPTWPEVDVRGPNFVAKLRFSSQETFGSLKCKLAHLSAHPLEELTFRHRRALQPDTALLSDTLHDGDDIELVAQATDGTHLPASAAAEIIIPTNRTQIQVKGRGWKVKFGYPEDETFGSLKTSFAPLVERSPDSLTVVLADGSAPEDSVLLSAKALGKRHTLRIEAR